MKKYKYLLSALLTTIVAFIVTIPILFLVSLMSWGEYKNDYDPVNIINLIWVVQYMVAYLLAAYVFGQKFKVKQKGEQSKKLFSLIGLAIIVFEILMATTSSAGAGVGIWLLWPSYILFSIIDHKN